MSISEEQEMSLYMAFLDSHDMRLIAPADAGTMSVDFLHEGGWRECRIWEGYFDASCFLFKEMLQQAPQANNLVFPALFNLRHAVEVALKYHIRYAGGTIPRGAGHDLIVLAKALQQATDDVKDQLDYALDTFSDCVLELAAIDPRSLAFRYSNELDGTPIKIVPERWDLVRLYFRAQELSLYFDGLSGNIDRCRFENYETHSCEG